MQLESKDLLQFEEFARTIAEEAGKVTLEYFRGEFEVETKDDLSPVTIADKKTEETLRRLIAKEFPDHGIIGEEFGTTNPDAELTWILDPIDGTKPFVAGVPQYTVLVALESQGDGVVGVIYNPPLGRMMVASRGNGCRLNCRPVQVGKVASLSQASVLASDYSSLIRALPERALRLLGGCRFAPGWGDAYGYSLVAEGKCDVMLDAGLKIWDAGPLSVCLEEAGGAFTDWEGTASIHIQNGLACNPTLHKEILDILGGGR